jgi:hypothetical protein
MRRRTPSGFLADSTVLVEFPFDVSSSYPKPSDASRLTAKSLGGMVRPQVKVMQLLDHVGLRE